MIFLKGLRNFASFTLILQWVWHLGEYGYEKVGVLGAIFGVMISGPLLPLSPFTAWLLMDRAQTIWFYLLLVTIAGCAFLLWFFKTRIYDEAGREV